MNKIYILCPANLVTGGPELLHQLSHRLNLLGYNNEIKYIGEKKGISPIDERYRKYNTTKAEEIEDSKENYIIVPEVYIQELKKYKNINKIIWWLSVDNYFIHKNTWREMVKSLGGLRNFNYRREDIIHFSQSKYASEFLKSQGIKEEKIFYLSDYLNNEFIKSSKYENSEKKKNCVLYNPKKGIEFTKKIMDKTNHIKWVPLENMNIKEMTQTMQTSKVYIDFGNHPGKDRIPREAAISGCCIITGKRGSAKYKEDVAILDEFKFDDIEENIEEIITKIETIFNEYDEEVKKFVNYKQIIKSEEDKFEKDVKNVFNQIIDMK